MNQEMARVARIARGTVPIGEKWHKVAINAVF